MRRRRTDCGNATTYLGPSVLTTRMRTLPARIRGLFADTVPDCLRTRTARCLMQIHSSGRVTPNLCGQFLEVGRRYTIKANPENGSIFSHWSGPRESEECH